MTEEQVKEAQAIYEQDGGAGQLFQIWMLMYGAELLELALLGAQMQDAANPNGTPRLVAATNTTKTTCA